MPESFNQWIVDKPLNGGAQALVFQVHKYGYDEPHVLKQLKSWTKVSKQASEKEQRTRFITEVLALKTLESIDCPRIVQVVDSSLNLDSETPLWYVMPFYTGGAMRANTDTGDLGNFTENYAGAVDRVLSIAIDLAETVSVMHSSSPQIVHRDINTQNIFFGVKGGRPILGDFGIAAIGDSPKKGGTTTKDSFGPWRWRPPEMKSGSDEKRFPGSDIYMIGGVIYEALSGGDFIGDTLDLYGQFVHEKKEFDLRNFSSDHRIPSITTMLRRCFTNHPDDRFAAGELQAACSAIQKWNLGNAPPDLGERQSRMIEAATGARRASGEVWYQNQREELNAMVKSVRERIAAARKDVNTDVNQKDFSFWTRVETNGFNINAENAFRTFTECKVNDRDHPVTCVMVAVHFGPDPKFQLESTSLVWRDREHEYFGFVSHDGNCEIVKESFHGDPEHMQLLLQRTNDQIDLLQDRAIHIVREFAETSRT